MGHPRPPAPSRARARLAPGLRPGAGKGKALIERALLVLAASALFVGGYFGVGWSVDPARARSLATAWDAAIPFLPWTIYVYLAVFPAAFLPLFVVRSARLFRRTIGAYMLAMVVSYAVFVAWPVTSVGLRADPSTLPAGGFTAWCLRTVYRLDPPTNLFPSLHLSIAALAAGSLWKARRADGLASLALVAAIAASITTVKQHFLADGVAGLVLAAVLYLLLLRPFRPASPDGPTALPRAGRIAFLAFLALVYVGLYAAMLWQHS